MISAETALNLMQQPVRLEGPRHIRLRSVGYAENILNQYDLRKMAESGSSPLKWLHNHQNNDTNHQNRRYLIDNTVEFLTSGIPVGVEVAPAAHQPAMQAR